MAGDREPEFFKEGLSFRPNRVEPRENPLVPVVTTTGTRGFYFVPQNARRFFDEVSRHDSYFE